MASAYDLQSATSLLNSALLGTGISQELYAAGLRQELLAQGYSQQDSNSIAGAVGATDYMTVRRLSVLRERTISA